MKKLLLLALVVAIVLLSIDVAIQLRCWTMMAPASGALAPSAPATVEKVELLRGSQSWDGAELPDYPAGKPELVAMRYVFPAGCKLSPHKHPVMNYGVVAQGELTIIGPGGKEKVVRAGEPVVEMVGTPHHGENRGGVPVVLYMFYVSQKGLPLSVPVPEGAAPAK